MKKGKGRVSTLCSAHLADCIKWQKHSFCSPNLAATVVKNLAISLPQQDGVPVAADKREAQKGKALTVGSKSVATDTEKAFIARGPNPGAEQSIQDIRSSILGH